MADVQVNLAFTADTSKVKAQLQDLQSSLKNLTSSNNSNIQQLGLTKDITSAISKVRELQAALQSATNVNTGKLDLGQFNQNLQQSKTTLTQYASALKSLGPEGQQAFSKLTTSILQAEVPMKRASKVLNDLKTTMMNTMKWQLSSSLLHGFIGAVQSAYGYAQDLNSSLNNIRIVTGYNTDQMATFAAEANKAAKALSTTTTAYTDASLIYYQQGLDDAAVKERTDVTIKLANVSRQSAEEVSSQMTAIWNNFDDGTKSLEYYADAITALGAKTASSSAEIAEGLQKFAAVSDTVGLSYEYATAALATVVAQTRQSADTVGTAFKTLFARIEGLKLGETLEDGTTFNQYSQALATIGVNIKDANGDLKQMDDILDELGAKWQDLSRDEQVAVAQKVAGVRQYQQMIALMDNYDIFKENVDVAAGSTGTLSEQADIYAESWEAAKKRVQASAQSIYQALLKDDFFIEANNNLSKFLDGINNIITSLGGLRGVLSLVGGILLRVFGSDLSKMMSTFAYNIKMNTSLGRQEIMNLRQEAVAASKEMIASMGGSSMRTNAFEMQLQAQDELLNKTAMMSAQGKELSDTEQKKLSLIMQELDAQNELIMKKDQELTSARNIVAEEMKRVTILAQEGQGTTAIAAIKEYEQQVVTFEALVKYSGQYDEVLLKLQKDGKDAIPAETFERAKLQLDNLIQNLESCGINTDNFKNKLAALNETNPGNLQALLKLVNEELWEMGEVATEGPAKLQKQLEDCGLTAQAAEKIVNNLDDQFRILGSESATAAEKMEAMDHITKQLGIAMTDLNGKTYTASEGMMALGSQLMSISMLINSLKGLSDIWNDDSTSYWEKLLSTFTSLGMVLPMVISSFSALNMQKIKDGALDAASIVKKGIKLALLKQEVQTLNGKVVKKATEGAVTEAVNKINLKEISIKERLLVLDWKRIAIFLALAAIIGTLIVIGKKWYDQQHAEEIAAQKATEAADKQREAYKKMQEEQQNLSTTVNSYQEIIDKMRSMTAGTVEYSESLIEANEKALELLKTFDNLESHVENGLIVIDEDSLQKAMEQQLQYIQNGAIASGLSDINSIQANNAVKEKDVIDSIKNFIVDADQGVQQALDNMVQVSSNPVPIDQTSQANQDSANFIASISYLFKRGQASKETTEKYDIEQIVSLVTDAFAHGNFDLFEGEGDNLRSFLKDSGVDGISDDLVNALMENSSDLQTLSISMGKLQTTLDTTIKSDVSNRFEQYKNDKQINNTPVGEAFDVLATKYLSNYMDDENNSLSYDEAVEKYATAMNYTGEHVQKDGETTFYNALGEEIAKIPDKSIELFAQYREGLDSFNKQVDQYLNSLEDWSQLGSKAFDTLMSFADGRNGDLGSYTHEDFQKLTAEDLGIKTDENAKILGFESLEDFKAALQQAKNIAEATWKTISKEGREAFGSIPLELAKKFDDFSKDIDGNFDQKQADKIKKYYDSLDEAKKPLMAEIDFDKHTTEENWNSMIKYLEAKAIDTNLKVTIKTVQEAQSKMKPDMSTDDYESIKNLVNWGEDGLVTYSEFVNSTYDQQVQYLQNAETAYRDFIIASEQDMLEASIERYNQEYQKLEELDAKRRELEEQNGADPSKLEDYNNQIAERENTLMELQAQIDEANASISVEQRQKFADEGLDVEAVEKYANGLVAAAEDSKLLSDTLKGNLKVARDVAAATMKMNRGIESLAKGYKDWTDVLKKSDKASEEYCTAMEDMKDAVSDVLGVSKKYISNDFITKHLKEIEKASTGSAEAIDNLRKELSEDIICQVVGQSDFSKVNEDIQNLNTKILDMDKEVKIGATLDTGEFITAANKLISDTQMTVDQAQAYWNSLGYEPVFETETKTVKRSIPQERTHTDYAIGPGTIDILGVKLPIPTIDRITTTSIVGYKDMDETIEVPALSGDGTPKIKSLTKVSSGSMNNYSGNNSGGPPSSGKSCFEAGTLIATDKGFKNIENIQIGDLVLSYNQAENKNEYSKVLQTMIHDVQENIYKLYIENDVLSVTGVHRFFIIKNNYVSWVPVDQINIGDQVLFADGTLHEIFNIESQIKITTVYNFEVSNNHNYYVGKNKILVHNKGGCFEAGTYITMQDYFKNIEDVQVGDIVLSYNEKTRKNEYSEVLQTMIHVFYDTIYHLYIKNEILNVTGIHKFLIKHNDSYKWIAASDLSIGDLVFLANGTCHEIENIDTIYKLTTVYNFEVSGNHNYYVGQNQVLAHNKGGSKSSTPAEKKDLTKKSDVVNRYKQIEDKLKVVNKNLDKYNALADLAYGKEKIKNMNNIIKAYDRQIKLQQQLIDEARNYAAIDQQGLNVAASELNIKLKYDKDGNIANIESVQQKIWEKLNALETEYNNQSTKEAQDEYQKKYIDPFNEKKDEFDKMLGLYESSLDKMNEATQAKLELEIEKMSKKLELANYKIKLKIEIRTDELEQFEEELEKLNDTAFTGAKKLAYFRAEMQAIKDISSDSKKGIKNALKNGIYKEGDSVKTGWRPITDSKGNTVYNKDGTVATEKYRYKETISLGDYMKSLGLSSADKKEIYNQILNQEAPKKLGYKTYEDFEKDWNFSEALIEELKEFKDVLKDANDALDEVKESVDSMIIDTFEHWQEVMEKNIRQAEHYANLSETWLDIIEQISGRAGMSSAQLKNLRQTDFDTQKNLVAATWQDYKMTSQQYEASKPAFKAMYDAEEANAKAAEDMVKKLDEQIGNYAGKDYNNKKSSDSAFAKATGDRAVKAKLEDKLANPEKYYGDKNYFKTKEGKAEKERLEEKLDKYTKRINAAKEERRQYELLAKESHDKAQQSLSDQQQMLDKVNELKEQGIQGLAQLIEKADEMLDKELHDLLNDFERSISGVYGSIDNMKTAFDQNKEIDERYIRDTEKIYELNKLNRDLEKKMDETSNIKAKQKLAELQEKIYKYAAEGVKMSKYDLEVMQKQYDLEVAKIALEEAQNAKTQVRLTRDAEGNYSYTYTADENKTAEAEQNYEDKLNDLIQYNNDYAVETQSAILSAQQSWEDAIEDLLSRRKEFTEEEYYAKLQEVNAYYTSQLQYFAGENEKASQHSMNAFVLEYDSYYDNTQKKIGVTRMFTDEEKANYEKVAEIYENAAIERDKEMFLEEQHYKDQIELINQNYQSELARANQYFDDKFTALENSYKAGYLTEEEYLNLRAELENKKNEEIKRINAQKNTDLENAARGHIDMINGITDDYHKDLKEDIELENGEHQAASDYWQGLMEKDYLVNGEYMGKIKDGNMGFITDTQSQFLPGLNTTYTSATETVKGFTEAVTDGKGDNGNNTLMGQINNAVDQNNKNVAAAMGAIELATSETGETAFEDLASTATSEINDINEASEDLAEQIKADVASGVADMGLSSASVVDWYNDCYPSWHAAKADIDAITSALNNMIATAADVKPINVSVKTDLNTPSSTETKEKKPKTTTTKTKTTTTPTTTTDDKTTTGGTKTTATSTQGDGKLQVGDKVTLLSQGYEDSWGNGKKISKDYIGKTVKINKYSNADKVIGGTSKTTGDYYISLSTLAGGDLGWVKKKQISGYDTGGYTGTWGRDGRFALLHQKELVLNEEDTQNMLAAVKTVREIAAMIDLQAQQANLAGQYALALGQLPFAHSKGMDQNVHITAEFPNVQDHNEVELALTSLVNRASQFAWRN